jgi:tRNA1Val (adenine37-N6)-methyltransferase
MPALVTSSSPDQRPKAAQLETTIDTFLGGRIHVCQPRQGFRAGLDSVMLAAAVPAKSGDSVCDLGAGVGTAALCLAARIGRLHITAVEIDEKLAALAQTNAERNACAQSFNALSADVLKRPRALKRQSFRHVLTNPPYHDIARGTRAPAAAKARATSSHASDLIAWLRFARALAPEGRGVEIIPLWPKEGAPAKRAIIRVRMNARAPLLMQPGLVLHRPDGKPTEEAEAVLRHAAALTT